MTRCKAFYEKLEQLKAEGNEEKLTDFCNKAHETLFRIEQHSEFMKKNILPSLPNGNVATIPEGATRPIRTEPCEIQEQVIPKMREALIDGGKVTAPKVSKWIAEAKGTPICPDGICHTKIEEFEKNIGISYHFEDCQCKSCSHHDVCFEVKK